MKYQSDNGNIYDTSTEAEEADIVWAIRAVLTNIFNDIDVQYKSQQIDSAVKVFLLFLTAQPKINFWKLARTMHRHQKHYLEIQKLEADELPF